MSRESPPTKLNESLESGELSQDTKSDEKEVRSDRNRDRRQERGSERDRKDRRSRDRDRNRSRSRSVDRKRENGSPRRDRRRERNGDGADRRDRRRSRSRERRRRRSRSSSRERPRRRSRDRDGEGRRRRPRSPVRPKPPPTVFKKNHEASTSEESSKLEEKEIKWSTRIAAVSSDDSQRSKFEKLLGMHKKPGDSGLKLNKVDDSEVKDLKNDLQKMKSDLDQQFQHGRQFTHYNRGRGFGI